MVEEMKQGDTIKIEGSDGYNYGNGFVLHFYKYGSEEVVITNVDTYKGMPNHFKSTRMVLVEKDAKNWQYADENGLYSLLKEE